MPQTDHELCFVAIVCFPGTIKIWKGSRFFVNVLVCLLFYRQVCGSRMCAVSHVDHKYIFMEQI